MEKGGTSVIADGYLVHGVMTEEEALFAFGFGVVCKPSSHHRCLKLKCTFHTDGQCLQLVDDLQDTLKDTEVNHQTLFTHGWTQQQSGTHSLSLPNTLQHLSAFVFYAQRM